MQDEYESLPTLESSSPEWQPDEPDRPRLSPLGILRDIGIVWLLTAMGGFFVGLVLGLQNKGAPVNQEKLMILVGISNLLLGTVGFVLSGCLAPSGKRWIHLACVALGVWLTGLVNIFLVHFTIEQWGASIIAIVVMMAVGGGVSTIFKKDAEPSA